MDPPQEFLPNNQGGFGPPQQRPRTRGSKAHNRPHQQKPQQFGSTQLFDDTSGYGNQNMMQQPNAAMPQQPQSQQQQIFPGQQILNDPMASMAVQYGSQFVPAGKEFVEEKIQSFLSLSKLKYYFAVDTTYVLKKLGLIIFPFAHQDWSLKYDKSEPVAPRYEINAPDLYIPSMAFTTYVLVCSYILGIQNKFTPEQLGMTSSSALAWLFIELMIIILTMYVIGISSQVRYLDLMALCGYKYVGMILAALGGLMFKTIGYYCVLAWMSISIAFFLARTLRLLINPDIQNDGMARSGGNKRRLYVLILISFMQPVFMYFLTRHLMNNNIVGNTIPS